MSSSTGSALTMLRRRRLITVVAVLALAGLVATLLTTLVPLAFAGPSAAASGHRLDVVVAGSGADDGTVTLDCDGDGGSHPVRGPACERLDELAGAGRPFDPVQPDAMCTMQFGGPQTAWIVGTWDGRPVDASFTRSGGCEIARWDTLRPVLPDVTS